MALESQFNMIPTHRKFALEAFIKKNGAQLPRDRDIDMLFVDIDRMENQFDRKYVLDRIYRLMDRIVTFEDYYSDDENVLNSMRPVIERQKKMLDEARDRVLAIRTFDKTYKVFVKVPAGYEG